MCLSVCLLICLRMYPSVCLSVCLLVCLPVYLSVWVCICLAHLLICSVEPPSAVFLNLFGCHSFIHSEDLFSALSRAYSQALPAQPRLKKTGLRDLKSFTGWTTGKGHHGGYMDIIVLFVSVSVSLYFSVIFFSFYVTPMPPAATQLVSSIDHFMVLHQVSTMMVSEEA